MTSKNHPAGVRVAKVAKVAWFQETFPISGYIGLFCQNRATNATNATTKSLFSPGGLAHV